MRKYLEKFAKYLTNVLLFLVITAILFALYSLIQLTVLQKDYVNYFGYTVFEVESGSMAPTINVNDIIVVRLSSDNIKKGDIITYKKDNDFITHRVIEVGGDKLITKGDSNNSEDRIVEKKEILGKIVKVFPRLGVWKEILLSPTVIIVIFVTLMIFSLGCAYNGKPKDDKKKSVKKDKKVKIEPIPKEKQLSDELAYKEKQKNEHIKEVVKNVKEDKKKYIDNDFDYDDIKDKVKSLKESKMYVDDIYESEEENVYESDEDDFKLELVSRREFLEQKIKTVNNETKKDEEEVSKKKSAKNKYKNQYRNQYKHKGKYVNKKSNKNKGA